MQLRTLRNCRWLGVHGHMKLYLGCLQRKVSKVQSATAIRRAEHSKSRQALELRGPESGLKFVCEALE
eukprot:7645281-Alexandrium_andersonii.AAC.1